MNKKQIFYVFGAMICVISMLFVMVETVILASDYSSFAGIILLISMCILFSIYSGFMYFYTKFFIEHNNMME